MVGEKVKAKERPKCKVIDCPRYRKMEGFCDICYGRYKKGFYNINGEMSLDASRKERALENKRKKRIAKVKQKEWVQRKEDITGRLEHRHLKILQDEYPESKKSWYCNALQFQTSDAMCFGRMFLRPKDRFATCHACHVQDSKLDFLEELIDTIEENQDGT